MRGLLIFLVLMLLIPISLAQSLDVDYQILYDKVVVTEKFNFEKETSFNLKIPEGAFAISVYADNKQVKNADNDYNIKGTKKVEVSYITKELLEKTTKNFFLIDIKVPVDIKKLTVKLTLPENSILDKPLTDEGSIFPKPTETETDGQRLSFIWIKQDFSKEDSFSIFVIYKRESFIWLYIIISFVALITLILIFVYKRRPNIIKKIKTKKENIQKYLKEDEQILINIIKRKEGSVEQGTLTFISDFSKAKVSALLDELEKRNIIKKVKKGKKNIIHLKRQI